MASRNVPLGLSADVTWFRQIRRFVQRLVATHDARKVFYLAAARRAILLLRLRHARSRSCQNWGDFKFNGTRIRHARNYALRFERNAFKRSCHRWNWKNARNGFKMLAKLKMYENHNWFWNFTISFFFILLRHDEIVNIDATDGWHFGRCRVDFYIITS